MNHLTPADASPASGHPGTEVDAASDWASRINARWRHSVENIIEAGRLLIDAKASLAHGQFESMVKTRLDFSASVAQRLMIVARDNRLTNPAHAQLLPRSWMTLYELTKLTDDEFALGVDKGIIGPEMERADVELIRPRPQRVPEPAESDDPDHSATGGVLIPSMDAKQSEEQEAGETRAASASASSFPALLAPVDRAAEEGAGRDASLHAPPAFSSMPRGGLAIAHNRVEPNDSLDFFPTPPWATRALFEHVFKHLERLGHCKFQTAWEPACGEGHMGEVLHEYFRVAYESDIHDYGNQKMIVDFLDVGTIHPHADWIITNPPFNTSIDFVEKALNLAGTGVAMFVRAAWLEGVERYERVFSKRPPTLVSFFTERVPLHKGRWEPDGATFTAYIWLVWIKGAEPRAPFWIPPGCRERLTKPEDIKRFGKSASAGEAA